MYFSYGVVSPGYYCITLHGDAEIKSSSVDLCFSYFLERMSIRNLIRATFNTENIANLSKSKKQDKHTINCSAKPVLAFLIDLIFS